MSDTKSEIESIVQTAFQSKTSLFIQAGGSKHFYGRKIEAEPLSLTSHTGITEYEPSELYITAKSGTRISEIEEVISEQNQMLPCEPPYFKASATIGGMVASGLAGPRRAYSGNVRDCILGTNIINGKGEALQFGGKVMKNVAGYDASRLMCGAMGTLGVITEVTFRLLPIPEQEKTIVFDIDACSAITKMNEWANTPLPISATFHSDNKLYIRLSGSASSLKAASATMGGESYTDHTGLWESVKEQTHGFFNSQKASQDPLWRISVPPNTPELKLSGQYALEWNAGLRWYKTDEPESIVRDTASKAAGHAILFKGDTTNEKFHPLSKAAMKIHKNLKQVFDPEGILNPEKIYAGL